MLTNDNTKSFSGLLNRIYDDWKEVYFAQRPDLISPGWRFLIASMGVFSFLFGSWVYIGLGVAQPVGTSADGAGIQIIEFLIGVPGLWVFLLCVILYGLFLGYLVGHTATKRGAISIFVAGHFLPALIVVIIRGTLGN